MGTVPEEIVTNWSTTLARFAETLQALAAFGEEDAPGREEAVTLLPRVQADSESLIRGIIALLKTQKLRMRALSKELHSEEAVLSRSKTQRLRVNELERLRKEVRVNGRTPPLVRAQAPYCRNCRQNLPTLTLLPSPLLPLPPALSCTWATFCPPGPACASAFSPTVGKSGRRADRFVQCERKHVVAGLFDGGSRTSRHAA